MWTRSELKSRAKRVLGRTYWKAFVVSLLLAFVTGGVPSYSFNSTIGGEGRNGASASASWPNMGSEFSGEFGGALLAIIAIAVIIGFLVLLGVLAFRIFLSAPLEVGSQQYFKQAALEDANMSYIGYAFGEGRYINIVKGMLWRLFLNFLWYLLLIIPGIVKSYAYSMTPFILADNPGIGTKRAVELSNQMTQGHKWRMFVLDLSFIGWYLLGTLAFFVGVLFVLPYVNAVKAELYLDLREQAVHDGRSSRAELNML
ncbi:DUF975 family protein [Paenibacillus doosanensis]|uniref:DUF975 family protein n=1 Tax=Paenibacillus konkukensis TaxID=2020716 RepID=A0ABY4S2Q7_9BACL|nr:MULTISPECIES: DUF975 family protein [Paenibacillus]MCS7463323.1 DUF975 family protein [Paenibacillus doosanensis]UQZ87628.1 hypothetical protein SK3146_06930 [Paenibacillus konkukensis]